MKSFVHEKHDDDDDDEVGKRGVRDSLRRLPDLWVRNFIYYFLRFLWFDGRIQIM